MDNLQIFNSEEFGAVRTVTIENEPWFVGKDVATALGYARLSNVGCPFSITTSSVISSFTTN